MSKTVPFQTIQFSISMQFKSKYILIVKSISISSYSILSISSYSNKTDCFIVSQLFSVSRRVGRLKLGLKPAQLYIRLSIIPLSQQVNHFYES